MTEYELITAREMLAQSNFALADVQASHIAIYLSMIFAYTTVAYVAGKQLSKVQVFIVTLGYMTASIYTVATMLFMSVGNVEYQIRIEELFPNEKEVVEAITLAVFSVILYHAKFSVAGWQLFPGGYLGVDIFFVISGYLITTMLMTELAQTGRISITDFYERRARRLLPGPVRRPSSGVYRYATALKKLESSLCSTFVA
jgi:hypothetical protein